MKKEIADKWVAALRSGDYKQGRHVLRDSKDRFCCLGVLCELSGLHEWKQNPTLLDWSYDGNATSIPTLVQDWAGTDTIHGPGSIEELMNMNDKGRSFHDIADVIEALWGEF